MEIGPVTTVLGIAVLAAATARARGFEEDVAFLRKHVDVVLLEDARTGARVAVVPAWQGRVMTSAGGGKAARGYGWINEELVASGKLGPHINAFGGEDRLWLGPEGGQFSIFFRKGDPFDLAHWQTPPIIDTEPWAVASKDARRVSFRHRGRLVNHSGTALDVQIDRTVRLLDREAAATQLGGPLPDGVRLVAFASENTLTNAGEAPWTRSGGLLSLWILGMFEPSAKTTVVVPFREGPEAERGPVVNDAYFGKVPPDRLVVGKGVLFFSGDGRHRSKIGLSPRRTRPVLGSYDAERSVLTVVTFDLPEGATEYVNSMWEIQEDPFAGDVVNSYNDGPPAPGAKPMGPFYELETSSPAAALAPGASLTHVHRTFHLEGEAADLDAVARRVLGVPLERIRTALPSPAR
ncbi:MAG TPA: DUF6786 family protein [Vicinamibacteria bacterium]